MKERKKVFFSYSYLLATVTTHPATFSTSSKQCSRGDRFPAPSPFLLLDNCNRGGESQWRSYLLRVSVRRVRIEGAISLLERNTGSQRILRTATVITTSDNPRSMPGGRGGEEGILENVCLATAWLRMEANVRLSFSLSLSCTRPLNGANLAREEERKRKREKETRRKGEKPRERGQRKRMKKKKKVSSFPLFLFLYISV